MYAVGIVGVFLLLAGIFLLVRHGNSPLLIPGLACIVIGIVLSGISRANRRK